MTSPSTSRRASSTFPPACGPEQLPGRLRNELDTDGDRCRACRRLLSEAQLIRRAARKIRSGEFTGDRGEFLDLLCDCGQKRSVVWSVTMAPYRGRP